MVGATEYDVFLMGDAEAGWATVAAILRQATGHLLDVIVVVRRATGNARTEPVLLVTCATPPPCLHYSGGLRCPPGLSKSER